MHKVAAGYTTTGTASRATQMLASAGSGGAMPSNIERDVHSMLSAINMFKIEPAYITLNLLKDYSEVAEPMSIPVLPVHQMFNRIWNSGCPSAAVRRPCHCLIQLFVVGVRINAKTYAE
eukprot:4687180-Alexandrium_andersonii.AAC.1